MQSEVTEASVAPNPSPKPELPRLAYSIEETAAVLGLSVSTIRRFIDRDRMVKDLLAFCERHQLVLPRRVIDFLRKY